MIIANFRPFVNRPADKFPNILVMTMRLLFVIIKPTCLNNQ
jgi:hypothetical protein